MAFRQANLSFTDTCNADEIKKKHGTKFTDFHTAKEEYIVSPIQVNSSVAVFLSSVTTWETVKSVIISLPLLSFCNLCVITGFEIGAPLIISEKKRSKVWTWLGLNMPGFDIPVVSVGKTMSDGWSLSSFLRNCKIHWTDSVDTVSNWFLFRCQDNCWWHVVHSRLKSPLSPYFVVHLLCIFVALNWIRAYFSLTVAIDILRALIFGSNNCLMALFFSSTLSSLLFLVSSSTSFSVHAGKLFHPFFYSLMVTLLGFFIYYFTSSPTSSSMYVLIAGCLIDSIVNSEKDFCAAILVVHA